MARSGVAIRDQLEYVIVGRRRTRFLVHLLTLTGAPRSKTSNRGRAPGLELLLRHCKATLSLFGTLACSQSGERATQGAAERTSAAITLLEK